MLTPQAAIVELPQGATPVDFAYTVHTSLGHRCRGARVDGVMVPLNTPLQNGQTVEIIAAKEGGPSRDWLNADLGFLASHRAQGQGARLVQRADRGTRPSPRGREPVEKLLQREGKTAVKLEDLAAQLASSRPTTCSRWSARTSTRCATSRRCCARPRRRRRRTTFCC